MTSGVDQPFDWSTASDDAVEHEYSPSRHALRPLSEYIEEYNDISRPYRSRELCVPGQPMLIYIHGGYWQRLSAGESLFNAADAERLGISLHSVEYTLAPRATIPEMIRECVESVVAAIERHRPSRVVLSGCSAGAHLAATVAADRNVSGRVHGVALLSGIYDLRPFTRVSDNKAVGLTMDDAIELSPLLHPVVTFPARVLCAVGRAESSEFIRQNADMATHLRDVCDDVTASVVEARDHFNLPYDLLRAGTVVGDWVLSTLEG